MTEVWKSPRAIEEDVTNYKRKRFEDYMMDVEIGRITQAMAIAALRAEFSFIDGEKSEESE